jgi:hypothetical protein
MMGSHLYYLSIVLKQTNQTIEMASRRGFEPLLPG